MKVRSTWMKLYQDVPFDGRFVVSNPGPRWTEMVAMENRTYGDMIVLDRIQEDDFTANTVKTLEFYKYLHDNNMRYEFISKMDTDSWLNARGFWDRFLLPRMTKEAGRLKAAVDLTVISELYYSGPRDLVFPNGSMYTITWDLVAMFVALQTRFNVIMGEDMTFSILLLKGKKLINFVNFRGSEKFDYDDRDSRGDGTAWARAGSHPNSVSHAVGTRDAILVHHLKTDDAWFKVAACFDEFGVKEIPLPPNPEPQPPFSMRWFDFWYSMGINGIWRERFEDIPYFLWKRVENNWICDDIFNMGPTKTGYNSV
jgi:beta-1,3-galactosyltransferase 1